MDNWANLSTYFKYPEAVRRLIYTTNTIEGFNRQLRKVTKSKTVFPSDESLLKMLYLAMIDITKKWSANSHVPRPAGPHFPVSQGHIKRPAWDISRTEGTLPY